MFPNDPVSQNLPLSLSRPVKTIKSSGTSSSEVALLAPQAQSHKQMKENVNTDEVLSGKCDLKLI